VLKRTKKQQRKLPPVRFNNAKELDGAIFCIGGVDNLIINKK
jgi:hypothetical protein